MLRAFPELQKADAAIGRREQHGAKHGFDDGVAERHAIAAVAVVCRRHAERNRVRAYNRLDELKPPA